jgi:hypothetical protein
MTAAMTQKGERLASDAKRQSAQGDHPTAIHSQQEAIKQFAAVYEAALHQGSETDKRKSAHKLSDQHGRLGGILRRAGLAQEALNSYVAGCKLEDDWQLDDSYNRTNRIVLSLLVGDQTPTDLRAEVSRVEAIVRKQVDGTRRRQWWAWADLGLLSLVNGDVSGALWAYENFRREGARPSDYRSTLSVLRELHAAIGTSAPALAPGFAAAEAFLEDRRGAFISYRRDEVKIATTLAEAMKLRLDANHVFPDHRGPVARDLAPGILLRMMHRSAVLVLLIGEDWPAGLESERPDGGAPDERIRREVAAGRSAGLRIVPVLLDDSHGLSTRDLPAELRFLAKIEPMHFNREGTARGINELFDEILGPA